MKNNLNLVFVILIFAVIGCTCPPKPSDTQTPNQPVKNNVEYKYGTKLLTQYNTEKDQTSVYQMEFNIKPKLIVNGQSVTELHTFRLDSIATYKGKTPNCPSKGNLALMLIHSITTKKQWHFEPKTKVFLKLDTEAFEMEVYKQGDLEKDDPKDKEFYDSLLIQPTCETYSKIKNANSIGFQIGNGQFQLSEENKLAFQEFVKRILPDTQ